MKFDTFSIHRLISATKYSLSGLKTVIKEQAAFRLELILCFVFYPLAIYWGNTKIESAILILSWTLVLIAELINSAIETIINRIGFEKNDLSGIAKDIGSSVVFVTIITFMIVWIIIILL